VIRGVVDRRSHRRRAGTRSLELLPARIRWRLTRSRMKVYVPIRGNTGIPLPGPFGAICSTAKDAFGNTGSDALGCILSYIAPRDGDDQPAKQAKSPYIERWETTGEVIPSMIAAGDDR
jgi:hypothetical protein